MTLVLTNTDFASKANDKIPCYTGKCIHRRGVR